MPKIRVLSLTEPWASLAVIGAKLIETRSRKLLSEPGPLAIHAAKSMPGWAVDYLESPLFAEPLQEAQILPPYAPAFFTEIPLESARAYFRLGHIIGVVDFVEAFRFTPASIGPIEPAERAYGDYGLGRWGLRLANPRRLAQPIPARGHQGIWYFDLPEGLDYVNATPTEC